MPYINPTPSLNDNTIFGEHPNEDTEADYSHMSTVYFAFIDVLGFKKSFDDMKISKNKSLAKKYQDVFNYYFELMNAANFMEKGKDTGCYAGQTSDSLYFYTNRPDFLMQFIKIFLHFNLYAMSKNVFFRGGIAKGELYKRAKYQFYGDSVIGAYLLEDKISKNPIIVIDENTHNDLKLFAEYNDIVNITLPRKYIKPFATLKKSLRLDIFPDFTLHDINSSMIKRNITYNKKAFEYDANNFEKYVFLQKELDETENNSNK